jgi:hypothetical protein
VDPGSKYHLELGTKNHPYKSIAPALIEIFNYLPIETHDYEVLLREGTTDYVKTLF